MSIKGKIPPELKIQAVEDYQAIRKGSTETIKELGIRRSTFQSWVRKYQTEGRSGSASEKGFYQLPIVPQAGGRGGLFKRRRLAGCHVPQIRDILPCGFTTMDYVV